MHVVFSLWKYQVLETKMLETQRMGMIVKEKWNQGIDSKSDLQRLQVEFSESGQSFCRDQASINPTDEVISPSGLMQFPETGT